MSQPRWVRAKLRPCVSRAARECTVSVPLLVTVGEEVLLLQHRCHVSKNLCSSISSNSESVHRKRAGAGRWGDESWECLKEHIGEKGKEETRRAPTQHSLTVKLMSSSALKERPLPSWRIQPAGALLFPQRGLSTVSLAGLTHA